MIKRNKINCKVVRKGINKRKNNINQRNDEQNHSIYDYWTSNPLALTGIITAIVAVCSAALRYTLYLYYSKYLNYWHISSELLTIDSKTIWNEIVIYLFYLMALMSLNYWYIKVFEYYYVKTNRIKRLKENLSKLKRKIKDIKKKSNLSEDQEDELKNQVNQIPEMENEIKLIKQSFFRKMMPNLIVLSVINIVINIIYFIKRLNFVNSIFAAIIFCVVVIGLFWFMAYLQVRKKEKSIRSVEEKYYPLSGIFKKTFRDRMSNKNILILFYYLLICILMNHLIILEQGNFNAKNKKEFEVFEYQQEQYAVIYMNSDEIIAEKIEIKDDSAIIYYDKQLIKKQSETSFKIYKFNNVTVQSMNGVI